MAAQRNGVYFILLFLFCSKCFCEGENPANGTESNVQVKNETLEERLASLESMMTEEAKINKLRFLRLTNAFGTIKANAVVDVKKEIKSIASQVNEQHQDLVNLSHKVHTFDDALQKMKERTSGQVVAFKARTPKDSAPESNQRIVYTSTILDEGNCFDNVTGMFTAPVDGIYLLTVQFCTTSSNTMNYNIVVDDVTQLMGYAYDANGVSCHSPSILVKMTSKQRAWVKSNSTPGTVLTWSGSYWNVFSGTLIDRLDERV